MTHYDLLVIGAGSGNMLLTPELADLRTAIVELDRFGGTCLNRGCIPSKMFVVAADAARGVSTAARLGVHASLDNADWPEIRDRIFGRIDPVNDKAIAQRKRDGSDVYLGAATFVGPLELEVNGERLTADRIVIATGSQPDIPDLPGLDSVQFHTSDTIMRLDVLPASMVIIGGGFIAAELGHVFASFGTKVTIVGTADQLLPAEDDEISARFTELAADRFELHLSSTVTAVGAAGDAITVDLDGPAGNLSLRADVLLVATGRRPRIEELNPAAAGLELDEHGHLVTDDSYATNVAGVWAFGDVVNHCQLKHLANAEMRVVAHNVMHPDDPRTLSTRVVPHAVFSDPQVASLGLSQVDAEASGRDIAVAVRHYSDTAYGWALEDTTSFVKVIADRGTRRILGAHIIGPDAALLIQPLVQAMMLDNTVDQVARGVMYIHPALTEVIEQALLEL